MARSARCASWPRKPATARANGRCAGVLHNAIAYSTEGIQIWFARGLQAGAASLDAGEFLEVQSTTLEALEAQARDGSLTDAKTLIGLLWLRHWREGRWPLQLADRGRRRAMKVLDLQCQHGHGFEGWFSSEADYAGQHERGLLECPLCGSASVHRLPSAPRLNLSNARPPVPQQQPQPGPTAGTALAVPADAASRTPEQQSVEALWLKAARHAIASTEDVGERFAEEARRIHYGETEQRGIRGRASAEEAQALSEEGIEVFALALPVAVKSTLQ